MQASAGGRLPLLQWLLTCPGIEFRADAALASAVASRDLEFLEFVYERAIAQRGSSEGLLGPDLCHLPAGPGLCASCLRCLRSFLPCAT
jgi:hypothetical protein